ncbi:phosphocarrier protein HPr [Brachyspira hampsonii]|uniref:Phosphocarrier protein HPr n=1 Tax=Brachyspira hampsonii TaxID=1287055 RepID=A0A1E5NC17_9SPIR|nr:HPr family phosphocarrier protein [Brachyspira hampsonii]OEJ13714.1 phosphocarrier protein HPr [Brachyspira hampsonii]
MTLTNVVTIKSKNGMHLRPAGVLSQISSKNEYSNIGIFLLYNGVRADAKSVFNIMGLGAFQGANLILEIEYDEGMEEIAKQAEKELINFFEEGYIHAEVPEDD